MVKIDTKTTAYYGRLLKREESQFLHLHKPDCILKNKDISPYQLYIELSFHLHVYFYYPRYLAKKLWEELELVKKRSDTLPTQDAMRRQIKTAYLPKIMSIKKNKLSGLEKIVNQSIYEKVLYEAVKAKDKRAIDYLNMLASDLKLKILPVKIPSESKSWKDYYQNSKLKLQSSLENNLLFNNSQFSVYKDGRLLRPNNDKGYGQFCARCDREFKSAIYRNGALFYKINTNDTKLRSIRIYKEEIYNGKERIRFVCSKKCYDALYVSKKRKPLKN